MPPGRTRLLGAVIVWGALACAERTGGDRDGSAAVRNATEEAEHVNDGGGTVASPTDDTLSGVGEDLGFGSEVGDADLQDAAAPQHAGSGASGPQHLQCPAAPTRVIVLGDSVGTGYRVGGKYSDRHAAKIFHAYAAERYASPALSYENYAIANAPTPTVADEELKDVPTGSAGRAIVAIFAGGAEMAFLATLSDSEAVDVYEGNRDALSKSWDTIFAFFDDANRFPDGAMLVLNTVYNPFDDCTASPYNISQTKVGLLRDLNDSLAALAASHENTWLADQHSAFLGHGHHYQDPSCPAYRADAAYWMADLLHPNDAGHAGLAGVLIDLWETIDDGC